MSTAHDSHSADQDLGHLLDRLASPDHATQYQAAGELLQWRDPAAVLQLLAALASPNAFVRTYVAHTLGHLGDVRAVGPLTELLTHATHSKPDVFANVGEAASTALGRIGDPRAVDALILALDDPYVQNSAAGALNRLGDRRAVQPLIAAVRTTHNARMATALGNLGDREAVGPLLEILGAIRASEMRPPLRPPREGIFYYYVVRALGKLGDARAVPLLEWVREHERWPVLKGRSIGEMAAKAIERIQQQGQE